MAVRGIGNKKDAANTNCTNIFLFSFQNSHLIKLSNPFTPRYLFEVVLQSVLTEVGLLNVNASLNKRTVNLCYRQSRIVMPDMMILDVMMPGMDGFAILKELRKTSKIPVLMLTARGEAEDIFHGW